MTKQEFLTTTEPLGMIVSINPDTGKVLHDTYDYRVVDAFKQGYEKDFPDMMHFQTLNPAGVKARAKAMLNVELNP